MVQHKYHAGDLPSTFRLRLPHSKRGKSLTQALAPGVQLSILVVVGRHSMNMWGTDELFAEPGQ